MIFITFAVLISVGVWRVGALHGRGTAKTDLFADDMNTQIRRGIGSQVRFASSDSSSREVRAAVQSAGNFIYARSGFKMSSETENRLVDLEQQTLNGERHRIKPETLINATTDIGLASLSALSDKEIDDAVNHNQGSNLNTADNLRVARDRHVSTRIKGVAPNSYYLIVEWDRVQNKTLRSVIGRVPYKRFTVEE